MASSSVAERKETGLYRPLDHNADGSTQLRLLHLLPGEFGDLIVATLSTHSIGELPKYYPLSYVWGQDIAGTVAVIDGFPVAVTVNLDAALRHLRRRQKLRTLWIDALCINQDDIEERGQQVQLMGTIYSEATRVFIWLGPTADGSDYVMDCLDRERVRTKRVPYYLHYLIMLIERPWFHRVWTLQEVLLAQRDPILVVGSHARPLSHLINFTFQSKVIDDSKKTFSAANGDLDSLPKHWIEFFCRKDPAKAFTREAEPIDVEQALEDSIQYMTDGLSKINWLFTVLKVRPVDKNFDLTHWLFSSRHRVATDPRDKIYGFLGMSKVSDPAFVFTPDYNKSVATVFSQAMALLITETFNYGYPKMPLRVKSLTDLQLPSWVPDFTYTDYAQFPERCGNRNDALVPENESRHVCEPCDLCERYEKGKLTHPRARARFSRFSPDFSVLYATGTTLGVLIAEFPLAFAQIEDAVEGLRFLMSLIESLNAHDEKISFTKMMRALTVSDDKDTYEYIDALVDKIWQWLGDDDVVHDNTDVVIPQELVAHVNFWFKTATSFKGRTLFLTDKGDLGLSFGELQVGDMLAGLFEMNFPFVLRKREDAAGFTMVNVAYIVDHTWSCGPAQRNDIDELDKVGREEFEIH